MRGNVNCLITAIYENSGGEEKPEIEGNEEEEQEEEEEGVEEVEGEEN